MQLKIFIKKHLFISKDKINGNRMKDIWILNNFPNYYKAILNETFFLLNVKITERIYFILNDMKEKQKCLFCKNSVKFKSFSAGYNETCSDKKCKKKYLKKIMNQIQPSGLTKNQEKGKKISEALNSIQSNGLTIKEARAKKASKTMKNTILSNGLTIYKNANIKATKTKLNNINSSGLNTFQLIGLKAAKTKRNDIIGGLNNFQRSTLKAAKTKANDIDSSGMNMHKRSTLKALKTKRNDIIDGSNGFSRASKKRVTNMRKDIKNGLDKIQRTTVKIVKTKQNDIVEGLNNFQRSALKMAKTRLNDINEKGQNSFQFFNLKNSKKRIKTMINDIDSNGNNALERSFQKGCLKGFKTFKYNSNLYCQGTFEKDFLDRLTKINLIHEVTRGPKIKYNGHRIYHSDFLIRKVTFEIKSDWIYDRRGNKKLRITNNLKWKATLEAGYKLIIVWNKDYLMPLTLDKIKNIEDSLFLEHEFLEFNKDNFLDCVQNKPIFQS